MSKAKETLKKTITVTYRKKFLETLTLMLGFFFLPFGFDLLFLTIMKLTNSYWTTDFIFYSLSVSFFILYFLYSHKVLLFLGTFFLPLGYDLLFKTILDYTGSYALTDSVFYTISVAFFITHFVITKTNPFKEIGKRALETKLKLIDLKSRI